jgi:hypothetical protein
MRHVKMFGSVVCVTMLLAGSAASAQSNFNRTTYLTFSTPVELPGITLPAGTYTFRLSDSNSDRHIVQVLDKDAAKLHTTILAIPAKRLHVSDDTVVTFHEQPAEATPAVRFWYYPGDNIGQEFAYPKAQASRIAAVTGEPVLAIDSDASMTASVTRVEGDARAETEAADTGASAQVETSPTRPEMQPAGTSGERRLPQTASNLPLVGIFGLLALGGALAARAARVRA